MRLNWKFLAVLPAVLLLGSGCGGFTASRSISPATFLLPGLMKADPPSPPSDSDLIPADHPGKQVASL